MNVSIFRSKVLELYHTVCTCHGFFCVRPQKPARCRGARKKDKLIDLADESWECRWV